MKMCIDGMKPQEVFALLLDPCLDASIIMPDHAIRDWIHKAFELVSKCFLEGKEKGWVTRRRNSKIFGSNLQSLSGEKLRTFLYDLYLSSEGLSCLSGFGYAAYESRGGKTKLVSMNPEYQSTYLFEKQGT